MILRIFYSCLFGVMQWEKVEKIEKFYLFKPFGTQQKYWKLWRLQPKALWMSSYWVAVYYCNLWNAAYIWLCYKCSFVWYTNLCVCALTVVGFWSPTRRPRAIRCYTSRRINESVIIIITTCDWSVVSFVAVVVCQLDRKFVPACQPNFHEPQNPEFLSLSTQSHTWRTQLHETIISIHPLSSVTYVIRCRNLSQ